MVLRRNTPLPAGIVAPGGAPHWEELDWQIESSYRINSMYIVVENCYIAVSHDQVAADLLVTLLELSKPYSKASHD